jgi:hypothetical protein
VAISVGPVELTTDANSNDLRYSFTIIDGRIVVHLAYETQEKADTARKAIQRGKKAIEALLTASSISANGRYWPK